MSLDGSLDATVEDGSVEFAFTVTNEGDDAVEMQFSDAQTFDIKVEDDGDEVWTFSEGMMFAQMLQTESLAPGESVTYEATWENASAGEYEATAVLTARNADCRASTTVSV